MTLLLEDLDGLNLSIIQIIKKNKPPKKKKLKMSKNYNFRDKDGNK